MRRRLEKIKIFDVCSTDSMLDNPSGCFEAWEDYKKSKLTITVNKELLNYLVKIKGS